MEWYFNYNNNENGSCCRPVQRYFCRNFGSVVAGSFINAFLNIICIIFDLFRVFSSLFSVAPKENVEKLELVVAVYAAVAVVWLTFLAQMPMHTSI